MNHSKNSKEKKIGTTQGYIPHSHPALKRYLSLNCPSACVHHLPLEYIHHDQPCCFLCCEQEYCKLVNCKAPLHCNTWLPYGVWLPCCGLQFRPWNTRRSDGSLTAIHRGSPAAKVQNEVSVSRGLLLCEQALMLPLLFRLGKWREAWVRGPVLLEGAGHSAHSLLLHTHVCVGWLATVKMMGSASVTLPRMLETADSELYPCTHFWNNQGNF